MKEKMWCVRKEAILLLFITTLHVQCNTCFNSWNIKQTDSRLSLRGHKWSGRVHHHVHPYRHTRLWHFTHHACRCENGNCVNEGGKNICKCNPGYGNYSETVCKACECGPDTNCMWKSGWIGEKICFCKPGYTQNGNKCVACNCGPDTNCTFIDKEFYKPVLKKCLCKPGHHEEKGKCVADEISTTVTSTSRNLMAAILPSTITFCDCGEYSKSCHYNWKGDKICSCFPGYAEKYGSCEECNCGPYGSCSFQYGQKTCNCRPFAFEKNEICIIMESTTSDSSTSVRTTILPSTTQYCNCGEYSKSCHYNRRGDKICDCFPGYAEKYGSCDECNCGPYGSCSFQNGRKTCSCKSFQVEINGVCVEMGTTSERTTDSAIVSSTVQECDCGPRGRCTLESGQKKCVCDQFTSEREGRCVDCYCGENSKSCHLNWRGDRICNCISGYAQFYGFCYECNCGVNSQSCFYRMTGTKVCNCDDGYAQTDGYCSAICSEEKCVHGKCEIMGNGFKCRCNEGFTGQRCEEKIQSKSNKLDLWIIMLLTVAFAMFILLSGMFCFLGRTLNKKFEK